MAEQILIHSPDLGRTIDVGPYIDDAIRLCPLKHDFTREEISELIVKTYAADYIPADVLDRIEGRNIWPLVHKVIFWIRSERRISQLLDPDVRRLRPYASIDTDIECCKASEALMGRWLQPGDMNRLPLEACDKLMCWCNYWSVSVGDVEKRGKQPSPWYQKNR